MMPSFTYRIAFYFSLLLCSTAIQSDAQSVNIKNDIFWNTKDGQPIYSQGGGIFKFTNPESKKQKYYWYGVHYAEADLYRKNPAITHPNATFEAVTCYSSTDLVNWTAEKDVLTKEELNKHSGKTWVGRLGVAYVKQINKYAMFVQHGNKVLITVSDSPTGGFTWHQEINMQPIIGTTNTGDQTVFTDEDTGKSYLIYSYGRGRNRIYVSEIGIKDGKVNILDCTQVFKGESREGNCMFKYRRKYYMCASNIYGWDSSLAYFLVAADIRGPYKPVNNMQVMKGCEADFAHITQTGFFVTVKGRKEETVIYCGDRWADFAGNGLGYNQWFPLSFKGKEPYFNSVNSWYFNEVDGTWAIAPDNNYAINGSFEADRNHIPSQVKPVQEQLTGWATTVLQGNAIKVADKTSPVLNYFNTEKDRKFVIGEKSLNITDEIDFKRKVSQVVSSTSTLPIPNGIYRLTAKIKNSNGFAKLQMFANSGGKSFGQAIKTQNEEWISVTLGNIRLTGGKIEIGFLAEGKAKSFCLVDDIELVRTP